MSGLFRQPRVFISATSADLADARATAKEALERLQCIPVEMATFAPDHRTVERKLRDLIRSCDALVHIVGFRYGAEPAPGSRPPGNVRRSYTQMEYDVARRLGIPCYVMLLSPDYPVRADEPPESVELQALQRAHRDAILREGISFETLASDADLGRKCRELPVARELYQRQLQRAAVAAVLCAGLAGVIWAHEEIGRALCATSLLSGFCAAPAEVTQPSTQEQAREAEVQRRYRAAAADCAALKQFYRDFAGHPLAETARRRFEPARLHTATSWQEVELPAPFGSAEAGSASIDDFATALCRRRISAPGWELLSAQPRIDRELGGTRIYSALCRYRYPVQQQTEDCS